MDLNQNSPVTYVPHSQLENFLNAYSKNLLAVIEYGRRPPAFSNSKGLAISIGMEQLNRPLYCEVWTSPLPISTNILNGVHVAYNEEVVFGYIQGEESNKSGLVEEAYSLYSRVFDVLSLLGNLHLYRMWNYFPAINEEQQGLERYKQFCIGRHRAFSEHFRDFLSVLPAASAVGTPSGPFHLYFLAGKSKGMHIENPRQISAYDYPRIYGPKSPSFARATCISLPSWSSLFIAGTASIVGHSTQHSADCLRQTKETFTNLESLKEHAKKINRGVIGSDPSLSLLKVYVRHHQDFEMVKKALEESFDCPIPTLYLKGEMCRRNLLVEIEAIYAIPHT